MTFFATYDVATGKIRRVGQCHADDLELQERSGQAVVERSDPTHTDLNAYVDLSGPDPVVTARPEMGATIDGLTISDIPVGAVLTIEGVDYTVSDGEAELSFSAAGTYTVTLKHWPHYDQSFEVVAP